MKMKKYYNYTKYRSFLSKMGLHEIATVISICELSNNKDHLIKNLQDYVTPMMYELLQSGSDWKTDKWDDDYEYLLFHHLVILNFIEMNENQDEDAIVTYKLTRQPE